MNQTQNDELVLVQQQKSNAGAFAAIIIFIWMMLGVLGFVTSLVCFAFEGSFMQNWVGFLTAMVLGPFYWIYFLYAGETYCKSKARTQLQKTVKQYVNKPMMGGRKKK